MHLIVLTYQQGINFYTNSKRETDFQTSIKIEIQKIKQNHESHSYDFGNNNSHNTKGCVKLPLMPHSKIKIQPITPYRYNNIYKEISSRNNFNLKIKTEDIIQHKNLGKSYDFTRYNLKDVKVRYPWNFNK